MADKSKYAQYTWKPPSMSMASHSTNKIDEEGYFINFRSQQSLFNLVADSEGFDESKGVLTAKETGHYLSSIILRYPDDQKEQPNATAELTHPLCEDSKMEWRVPQPIDLNQFEKNHNVTLTPDNFIDEIVTNSDTNTTSAFKHQSIEQENRKRTRLRLIYGAKERWGHFPVQSELANRYYEHILAPIIPKSNVPSLDDTPAVLFARVFKLQAGTQIRIKLNNTSTQNGNITCWLNFALIQPITPTLDEKFKVEMNKKFALLETKHRFCSYITGKRFPFGEQVIQHFKSKRKALDNQENTQIITVTWPNKKDIEKEQFICKPCGKAFSTEESMMQHVSRVKHVECFVCKKKFLTKKAMFHHKKAKHKEEEEYKSISYRVRPGSKRYYQQVRLRMICDVNGCGRPFNQPQDLRDHHREFRHYSCAYCLKRFISKKNLLQHEKDAKHDLVGYYSNQKQYWEKQLGSAENKRVRKPESKAGEKKTLKISLVKEKLETATRKHTFYKQEMMNVKLQDMELSQDGHCELGVSIPQDIWKKITDMMAIGKKNYVNHSRRTFARGINAHITLISPFINATYGDRVATVLREVIPSFLTSITLDLLPPQGEQVSEKEFIIYCPISTENAEKLKEIVHKVTEAFPVCKTAHREMNPRLIIGRHIHEKEYESELIPLQDKWPGKMAALCSLEILTRTVDATITSYTLLHNI